MPIKSRQFINSTKSIVNKIWLQGNTITAEASPSNKIRVTEVLKLFEAEYPLQTNFIFVDTGTEKKKKREN